MKQTRRKFSAEFKAKVAIEALKERKKERKKNAPGVSSKIRVTPESNLSMEARVY